jgi:hypothetical protein
MAVGEFSSVPQPGRFDPIGLRSGEGAVGPSPIASSGRGDDLSSRPDIRRAALHSCRRTDFGEPALRLSGARPCYVRKRTRLANDECLGSRPEHRISENDQTAVPSGTDGGQPLLSVTSVRFEIPEAQTRPRVEECGPPWRRNRSPIATPERRSPPRRAPRQGTPEAPGRRALSRRCASSARSASR